MAHTSGSGWVQALGALVAGFLVVGLASPALAVQRARAVVTAAPTDGTAGNPVELTIAATAPLEVRPLDPPGPPASVHPDRTGSVVLVPPRRGELAEGVFELASAAPFGLLWWRRRVVLTFPRAVVVAPRRGAPAPVSALQTPGAHPDEAQRPRPGRLGEPRGVRAYEPGDSRRLVHWPATAHAGSLMVRVNERAEGHPLSVRVSLPPDPDAAEAWAERALGTVTHLLADGRTVVLVTTEPGGVRTQPVRDMVDAGRRLARAVPDEARGGPSSLISPTGTDAAGLTNGRRASP